MKVLGSLSTEANGSIEPLDNIVAVGASRDLAVSDLGKVLEVSGAYVLTVPSTLPPFFNCIIAQMGAQQASVAAGSGASVVGFGGLKTPGQYGEISVRVRATAGQAVVSGGVA